MMNGENNTYEGMHEIEIRQRIQSIREFDYDHWHDKKLRLDFDGDEVMQLLGGLSGNPDDAGEMIALICDVIGCIE